MKLNKCIECGYILGRHSTGCPETPEPIEHEIKRDGSWWKWSVMHDGLILGVGLDRTKRDAQKSVDSFIRSRVQNTQGDS